MRKGWMALSIAFAMLVGLGAALTGAGAAHAAGGMAYVRVVHAAPAAPLVDVYVDNGSTPLLSNFKFATVTGYVPLPEGSHTIAVTPAGQPASAAVIKQSVTVTAGTNYTVAAIGDSGTTPALVAFVDDNSIASGMAKVRVYHLSSDAGPVAVATGGKTVIPSLSFKNASGYLTVPAASYTFDVTLLNANKTVQQPATLQANHVISVFAVGLAAGSGATALQFAAATVAGVPTGMPQTGFAPHPATTGVSATPIIAGALLLLVVVLGSFGAVQARRRAR